MKPSSGAISISASARKIDVDNRIPLRNYYRIANNLLKQADIYRSEKNIIDLYVMLLRFSSLISETIPHHQDYHISLPGDKLYFRKRLLTALTELESLKPDVQLCLEDLNRKFRDQANSRMQTPQNNGSLEWPIVKWQTQRTNQSSQVQGIVRQDGFYKKSTIQGNKQLAKPKEERFGKLSFTMSLPKQETLSRHSILGPGGLHGQWQSPSINKRIHYPSDLDSTPVEIPSLLPQIEDKPIVKDNRVSEQENSVMKDNNVSEQGNTTFQEVLSLHDEGLNSHEDSRPMINLDVTESLSKMDIIKELSPPPVLAEVQDVSVPSQGGNALSGQTVSLQDELLKSEAPLEVHISATMMDAFMRVAKSNTNRNLETCGVLAGSLKNRKFYVTSLIIPKQESTSDSCQTTNEEEIFEYQDKQSLFPLGWIHTHPTQSCFMSSIDVHTHYSYQVMLPEAIAIVMAPRDSARPHGIFRLTTPGGMSVIRHCPQRGFHAHKEPPDGGPLYDRCSDVYMDPKLKFDVVDLR